MVAHRPIGKGTRLIYFAGLVVAPMVAVGGSVIGFASQAGSGGHAPRALLWMLASTTVLAAFTGIAVLIYVFRNADSDRVKNWWLRAFLFAAPIALPMAYARLISPRPLKGRS